MLVVVLVGMIVASVSDWRVGIRIVSGALVAAAALRLVLPQRDAGMLAVRHRLLDVAVLVGVATALFVFAATIPDQPV
ncbi:MAG TPA: DUF3017 domain-containing protein [Nocardioides sp.]|nr:DUF3017 domain-containing protein [Nocardioides sp.]